MTTNGHQEKRARIDLGKPLFHTIIDVMVDYENFVHQEKLDISKLELEIRLGMVITGNRRWRSIIECGGCLAIDEDFKRSSSLYFKAGSDVVMLGRVKRILANEGFQGQTKPQCRQRISDDHIRWEVDDQGSIINKSLENKQKLRVRDVAMLSYEYDFRVAIAVENPIVESNQISDNLDPSSWVIERVKRRVTYTNPRCHWIVDITEVTTTNKGKTDKEIDFEIEIELLPR